MTDAELYTVITLFELLKDMLTTADAFFGLSCQISIDVDALLLCSTAAFKVAVLSKH